MEEPFEIYDDGKREVRRYRATIWCLSIIGIAMLVFALVGGAGAHQIPDMEIVYPAACCNSAATHPTGDCAPISSSAVTEVSGGYQIELQPGDHPKLLTKGYSGFIRHADVRTSPNMEFHICLQTDGRHRFCFFAPPGAS